MAQLSIEIPYSSDGYGFFLTKNKTDKTFSISKVNPQSPAEEAGLMEGDLVLRIDNQDTKNLKLKHTVKKIQKDKKNIKMTVSRSPSNEESSPKDFNVDDVKEDLAEAVQECEEVFLAPPQQIEECVEVSLTTPSQIEESGEVFLAPPPQIEEPAEEESVERIPPSREMSEITPTARLCQISLFRSPSYGFTLVNSDTTNYHQLSHVTDDSPASNAGIREGDILIEVNDTNVEKMDHDDVVEVVKSSHGEISLLVVDKASYDYFTSHGLQISSAMYEIEHCRNFEPVDFPKEEEIPVAESSTANADIIIPEPILYENLPENILLVRERMDIRRKRNLNRPGPANIPNSIISASKI